MPQNPLVGALTPRVRQAVYVILALAGVALAVLQIIYDADPLWLNKLEEVLAYLGTIGIGTLAASNIARTDLQQDAPVNMPERAMDADGDGRPDIA